MWKQLPEQQVPWLDGLTEAPGWDGVTLFVAALPNSPLGLDEALQSDQAGTQAESAARFAGGLLSSCGAASWSGAGSFSNSQPEAGNISVNQLHRVRVQTSLKNIKSVWSNENTLTFLKWRFEVWLETVSLHLLASYSAWFNSSREWASPPGGR